MRLNTETKRRRTMIGNSKIFSSKNQFLKILREYAFLAKYLYMCKFELLVTRL